MNTIPDEPKQRRVDTGREIYFLKLRKHERPQPGIPIMFFWGFQWHKGIYKLNEGFVSKESEVKSTDFENIFWFYIGGNSEN